MPKVCLHLPFNHMKATQAINYFARLNGGQINKLKVIKLMFFAERYHIRKYGRPIAGGEYIGMDHGPVNSGVKDIAELSNYADSNELQYAQQYIEPNGPYYVKSTAECDDNVFSDSDIEALSFAWEHFGPRDRFELRDLTHEYPEWKKHENSLRSRSRFSMNYLDFLEDPETDVDKCYDLSPDAKEAAIEEVLELAYIQNAWQNG